MTSFKTVIAIDGPSGSGKGTVARCVAARLGFAYLDSGMLYRLLAFSAKQQGISWGNEAAIVQAAEKLDVIFSGESVLLSGKTIDPSIYSEEIGGGASQVAVFPAVRAALLTCQRNFAVPPGLVADGRDMGSIVFPDAKLKVFLTADATVRAQRRYKQLIAKGESVRLAEVLQEIIARDTRDRERAVSPLQVLPEAYYLDTTRLTVDEAVDRVLARFRHSG